MSSAKNGTKENLNIRTTRAFRKIQNKEPSQITFYTGEQDDLYLRML